MNVTFLIGNGFDLGLGLKTGYGHFYPKYCRETSKDTSNIKGFKRMLRKNTFVKKVPSKSYIDWSDFEKAIGEHAKDFPPSQEGKYIERFENFIESFNLYLESQEALVDYSEKDRIAKAMWNAVSNYYANVNKRSGGTIKKIYDENLSVTTYNFISFNYTTCLDKFVKILAEDLDIRMRHCDEIGETIHAHGYIQENMILGVDKKEQIVNPKFSCRSTVCNKLIKSEQDRLVQAGYEETAKHIIQNSDIICIYGMSIGETDETWWNCIAQWLLHNPNHALVILKHDNRFNKQFPHTQTYLDIAGDFLKLSGLPNHDREVIRPRVFVDVNHDVFSMDFLKNSSDLPKIKVVSWSEIYSFFHCLGKK